MNSFKDRFLIFSSIRTKPLSLTTLLCFQILSGSTPILVAWASGKLIDKLHYALNEDVLEISVFHGDIFFFISLIALFLSVSELVSLWHNFYSDYFKDLIYKNTYSKILEVVSNHPTCEMLENPSMYSNIILAKENAVAISEYVSVGSQVLAMIFSVIAAVILSLVLAWWIPIILLLSMVPFIYYRAIIENKTWRAKETYSESFKRMHLYDDILTSPLFAKEIRIYRIQKYILEKWTSSYLQYFKAVNVVRMKGSLKIIIWAMLSWMGPIVAYFYVSNGVIHGKYSLGELSYLFGIVLQLRNSLTGLMYNFSDVVRTFLASKPLVALLKMKNSKHIIQESRSFPNVKDIIIFNNVSFVYPNSDKYVLKNINLSIKKGDKIAIVGRNGSGKSTLIKLVCGFYPVTEGQITWNGIDVQKMDLNSLRSKINTLFQEYGRFPLTVRENIELDKIYKNKDIHKCLEKVDLSVLSDSLDKTLSKLISGGIELSGGQWQRLALARFIANGKGKELFILDEPTAAIDPHAEYEIINLIKKYIQDHTTLLISHRLSMCRFMDRILVLEDGKIIEEGTHGQLMTNKGEYFDMFTKQKEWYDDSISEVVV